MIPRLCLRVAPMKGRHAVFGVAEREKGLEEFRNFMHGLQTEGDYGKRGRPLWSLALLDGTLHRQ